MGQIRTLGSVLAVKGTPTPVFSGTPLAIASYWIANGIATVTLTPAIPANGFNGPNNAIAGNPNSPAGGQQVTLWGLTTGTYFNGKKVTVIRNNGAHSFSFYTTHADVASAGSPQADTTGFAAASPFQHYRAVRIECGQGLGTDLIYVGDLNVSSTRYVACLSLAGQLVTEIASENIPADGIFIDTSGSGAGDVVMCTLIY